MLKQLQPWVLATRPKTLPAALTPVLLATAEAYRTGWFDLLPALICALFALLIQVGANFANDYYDYIKGADNEKRTGPTRAVASGLIRPEHMKRAMYAVFALAFAVGLGLIPFGGWWLLLIGVASVVCGIAYTGGPFPIAYKGLGEVFVMLFFGFVAVCMTYYVQANYVSLETILLAAGCGALSTNLLVVNNIRDITTDREASKMTLAARFGRNFGIYEYQIFLMLAWMAFVGIYARGAPFIVLTPCALYPLGRMAMSKLIRANDAPSYNQVLALTALLLLAYGLLGSTALVLATVFEK